MAACVVAAGLLLTACGEATRPGDVTDPTPSASSASPSPTAETTTSAPDPPNLADFPLSLGYPDTNGYDGSPVEVTATSGVDDLLFCDELGWSPTREVRPVDLIGTTYTGEAEDSRGRTLARYPEAYAAREALSHLRSTVEACPEDMEGGTGRVYTVTERDAGFLVTLRYRGEYGFDTGLTLIDVARVGDLLLISSEYGEGGGTDEIIRLNVRDVSAQTDELVVAMHTMTARPG